MRPAAAAFLAFALFFPASAPAAETASPAASSPAAPEAAPARPVRQKKTELPEKHRLFKDGAPSFDGQALPGLDHPLTQRYIARYAEKGRLKWLAATLKDGEPYLAFIRGEIEKRGLPPYLLYVPLIESGFAPAALSRSGASGLWQFMRNSVKPYLHIDEWVDERRDFYKSTLAALSKLEENYRTFGDWYLALAAYNSGAGEIARTIQKTGIRDYWELNEKNKLKEETAVYVPRLLAVYYIACNPRRYNLERAFSSAVYEWALVPVQGQVDVRLLAAAAGLDAEALLKANRELLFAVTPPVTRQNPYSLKVRSEEAEVVREALARGDIPLVREYVHVIKAGDTLSALALRYGVSAAAIAARNEGLRPHFLQIGQRVLIPVFKELPPGKALAAAAAKPEVLPRAGGEGAGGRVYLAQKGDTLFGIARRYAVSVEALAAANGMAPGDTLSIGRQLRIP